MSDRVTIQELVDQISAKADCSKSLSQQLINETAEMIAQGLLQDGQVNISGLGKFKLKWANPRPGRNPQTGETIEIPGHSRVVFKPEKSLRLLVNRRYNHLKAKILKDKHPANQIHDLSDDDGKTSKRNLKPYLLAALIVIALFCLFALIGRKDEDNIAKQSAPIAQNQSTPNVSNKTSEKSADTADKKAKTAVAEEKSENTARSESTNQSDTYFAKKGDTLWWLSKEYYNNSFYWPNIYRVNHEHLPNPDLIELKQPIEIPDIEGNPGQLTRADSHNIAKGYKLVYKRYKELGKQSAEYYSIVSKNFEPDSN
jgi:DNA-binding protein HU-beta/DNA-binding protein HU-alpha